ncbi:RhuM family protein [Aeromonas sp. EERV15]|uniref:RhuM family protein n=1 Tax=Aeromonas sp. EERV15 TaxID=1833892 RepID=UPI00083A10AE|nr:RhuM family protein [Aeromonas sp. EERV15]
MSDTAQQIAIFEGESGEINVTLQQETVWLNQAQLAQLFAKNKRTISEHIRNLFKEGELEESVVVRNFRTTASDGKSYDTQHYNLDVIISVGYRVKSPQGVRFRQWATRLLKEHLLKGYTLNQQRFEQNARELEAALALVRNAARGDGLSLACGRGLVEIISRYTQTFLWLQRYDEGLLTEPTGTEGGLLLAPEQAMQALGELKAQLMARGEATELFARPRGDGLAALLGNLGQSVFGQSAYPTVQSKAAHLLYFVVKNHPFTDGNKRSAAFLFVDFLYRNQALWLASGEPIINDSGLAALTLLVAESAPAQKETLIRLIINMLTPALTATNFGTTP